MDNQSEIVLYTTTDGKVKIDTIFQNETIWLTQKKMAELFDVKRPAITKHLKNIFESGELDERVVGSILEHTTQHGAIEGKTQTKEELQKKTTISKMETVQRKQIRTQTPFLKIFVVTKFPDNRQLKQAVAMERATDCFTQSRKYSGFRYSQ